jgi:hypothetical protein
MKRLSAGSWALALLSLASALTPIQAQTTATATRSDFSYDLSREVTLSGTVTGVVTKPTAGMAMGSHLLLTTASGPVDASLGRFALRGNGALAVASGRQVEVTGVMNTIKEKQVFLARIVRMSGTVYTIRNQRGLVVSPQARARASRKTAGEGL